ncbi:MAG: preprotein translocase subunit YajC [Planctomycetota bacterium]
MISFLFCLAQAAADDRPFAVRFFDNPLLLPVGLLAIFYVTFWAPERRRKAEEARLLASIQKNDRVITAGGIHAVVVAAAPDSDVVTIKIDENGSTRVKINRSAISSVVSASQSKAKSDGESSD